VRGLPPARALNWEAADAISKAHALEPRPRPQSGEIWAAVIARRHRLGLIAARCRFNARFLGSFATPVMRVARERLAADGGLPAVLAGAVRVLAVMVIAIREPWRDPAVVPRAG
jgi:hypothetical protein